MNLVENVRVTIDGKSGIVESIIPAGVPLKLTKYHKEFDEDVFLYHRPSKFPIAIVRKDNGCLLMIPVSPLNLSRIEIEEVE